MLTEYEKKLRAATDAGKRAFADDVSVKENPYLKLHCRSDNLANCWALGWLDDYFKWADARGLREGITKEPENDNKA